VELEQEIASIITFALHSAEGINPYYWNISENFVFPAMFFPVPEITTSGDTFRTYASMYSWYISVFAATTEKAHAIGLKVLTQIKRARNYVPLIDIGGNQTGKNLRLEDPLLQNVNPSVAQITLRWTSRRPYDAPEPPKVQMPIFQFYHKEDSPNGNENESRRRGKNGTAQNSH